jgi:predicted dehydrogenase
VTANAAELKSLLTLARENKVFFMEAMWTRFQPLAHAFKRILEGGRLGPPVSLHADVSRDFDIESACVMHPSLSPDDPSLPRCKDLPTNHRILDPNLGGGALLDLYVPISNGRWVIAS